MIRHIVMWKLSATDAAEKEADFGGIQERLEALVGLVPGLQRVVVSRDLGETEANFDVVLVSEHDDPAALAAYQVDPRHVEAAGWIKQRVSGRACVDFTI